MMKLTNDDNALRYTRLSYTFVWCQKDSPVKVHNADDYTRIIEGEVDEPILLLEPKGRLFNDTSLKEIADEWLSKEENEEQ